MVPFLMSNAMMTTFKTPEELLDSSGCLLYRSPTRSRNWASAATIGWLPTGRARRTIQARIVNGPHTGSRGGWSCPSPNNVSTSPMQSATSEQTELLVDTHVHTRYSDGIAGVPRIERHCRNRNLGVAVTDHNEIRGAIELYERDRAPVIPGIEVGTEEGIDLLVYFDDAERLEEFYRQAIEPFLRTRFMVRSWVRTVDSLKAAKELDAYISLAHPFALGRKSLDYQHGRRGRPFVKAIMD